MARLSFEKKRTQQPVGHPAVPVRVFGAGSASVGGTSVLAAPGEEIQQAVLNHLQRLAISLGAPIQATIQDDLAGCVVPLEVSADGSSRMTGEPVPTAAPKAPVTLARTVPPATVQPGTVQMPTGRFGPPPMMDAAATGMDVPVVGVDVPVMGGDAQFVDAGARVPAEALAPAPAAIVAPAPAEVTAPAPVNPVALVPAEAVAALLSEPPAPASTHTPARGFDAVAEEVLGDGPLTETAEGAELLTEPMSRINEAVRAGRIDTAAELADRTLTEASAVLGPRHAEVLHLRELSAYIAYLGDDPARACRLSVDVARLRRQAGDGDAAYGNVRSAATAWRAVRDPEEGLRLGRDLIDLWTDLTAEPGPAADDERPLEAARARMVRLTARAAKAAQV
ncbi:hypothetical protein JK361_13215 [Streptomyces sp. 5-8]|uniref:Tetratricopeptide repeat protein n=1 Tax=Streptomyces musisoli TaxID=2802280 RepID=A0ABS1P0I0_9ACTN|nr:MULTISPECIES: hypothetical protein [Streptomyces]MBL1105535.1 hypothetical protein [Streptomyces musisoli]MBY8843554.1 hypothetical protein [Streptomyces sp. SP2-10]